MAKTYVLIYRCFMCKRVYREMTVAMEPEGESHGLCGPECVERFKAGDFEERASARK